MKIKYFLVSGLVLLSLVFIGLQLFAFELYAAIVRSLLLGLLTIFYFSQTNTKWSYFLIFLTTFLIADILGLFYWVVELNFNPTINYIYENYIYYIGNGLYILSYIFLIIQVLKNMNIKEVITKLSAHIVILVVLDIFCVTIVTNASRDVVKGGFTLSEYLIEFSYNAVIMSLLTLAVINYIHKVNKKAMNLLIGSIFVVFSEMIQSAYFYINEDMNMLNVLCSLFLVIAFLFLYLQESLMESDELTMFKEHLEA